MSQVELLMEILRSGTEEQKAAVRRVLKYAALLSTFEDAGIKCTMHLDGHWTLNGMPEQFVNVFGNDNN